MRWKCTTGLTKVKYLGHLFSAKGMEPGHQKVFAVCDWDTLKNVSELKSFLGLASYYQCYICQFADIVTPLNNLTNKAVFLSRIITLNQHLRPWRGTWHKHQSLHTQTFLPMPASFNYILMQVPLGGRCTRTRWLSCCICKQNTEPS